MEDIDLGNGIYICVVLTTGYGAELGYADPKSIASSGAIRVKPDGPLSSDVMDPKYAPGAIGAYKPTVMAAVPIIWDIMKKGVESKIGELSPGNRHIPTQIHPHSH